MSTQFATSPDGKQIAYDSSGEGPAIVLIHGGGGRRLEWHEAGYVERLRDNFMVITVDLRGHGESDLPTDPTDYTTDKMGQDILAVADACDVEQFTLWGISYGSKICRYLAVQSDRVVKLILIGAQLGPGVSGQLRQDAYDFCEHWPPILEGLNDGTIKTKSLPQADQEWLQQFKIPVVLAWVWAMLDWPVTEPADFRCPTLWLAGSEDQDAIASIKEYEDSLPGSMDQVSIVEGLDHQQAFEDIEAVFPILLEFCES